MMFASAILSAVCALPLENVHSGAIVESTQGEHPTDSVLYPRTGRGQPAPRQSGNQGINPGHIRIEFIHPAQRRELEQSSRTVARSIVTQLFNTINLPQGSAPRPPTSRNPVGSSSSRNPTEPSTSQIPPNMEFKMYEAPIFGTSRARIWFLFQDEVIHCVRLEIVQDEEPNEPIFTRTFYARGLSEQLKLEIILYLHELRNQRHADLSQN
ncbi:hypothetical protein FB446DRAFT_793759 [Lentinula raphanica]|nr:hypothetical protein FB446DRAFT_793759 [Lentinula raphanica]